jgi:raffinose/stachyose/melibiose transport system substrate-binding protein
MRKSIVTALAVATVVGLGLTGCSGPGSKSGAVSQSGSGDKFTLAVAGFEGGGAEIACIPQINTDFQKKYPNVTLDYKYVGQAQFDTYLNPRFAAGNAPDVIMTNPVRTQQWQKQGFLAELSDQAWVQNIYPNVAIFGQVGGKTYTLPQQNIPLGLYANLDILKAAGINSVPQTWPEFLDALKTLKTKNQPGLLLANQGGWTSQQLTMELGVNQIDPNWGPNYDTGNSKWNPTWSPVLDQIKTLLTTGLVDGKQMNGIEPFNIGNGVFIAGKWAFTVMGAWELQHIAQTAKFNFSLNPFPGGAAGSKPVGLTFVGSGWGVNAASKHQQAAKDYVAFMADPINDGCYLKAENSFSTLKNVPSPTMPNATSFVAAFNDGRSHPAPIEYIKFPTYEPEFWKVGSSLFDNPTASNASLLTRLDQNIPKTK